MYAHHIPWNDAYFVMKEGRAKSIAIPLATGNNATGHLNYFFQMVTSHGVKVEFFIADMYDSFYFENCTSDGVPVIHTNPSFDHRNWMKCQSIKDFTAGASTNIVVAGDFTESAAFLGIRFTPLSDKDTACSACLTFGKKYSGIKPVNKPVATDDKFSIMQGKKLTVTLNQLIGNDVAGDFNIADVILGSATGGKVVRSGNNFEFTPTARFGEKAGFNYAPVDSEGNKAVSQGMVDIMIEMLPDVSGFIMNSDELKDYMASYTPPTFQEIFNSWNRYYGANYYPSGTPPQGEAAAWEMMSSDQFRCTVNSSNLTGFVSPEKFLNYEHTVDLSSTSGDDDGIGVIVAFERIGSNNNTLMLYRESGGMTGHTGSTGAAFVLVVNGTFTKIKAASGKKSWVGSAIPGVTKAGWNKSSPTRIYIKRSGDIITAKVSPFLSTDVDAGETITINLNDYPNLAWAKGEHPYGYCCFSQQYSSFSNVVFSGSGQLDTDHLYDSDTGDVFEYRDGEWVVLDEKIWDYLDYPRYIANPNTGKRYYIERGKVTEVE